MSDPIQIGGVIRGNINRASLDVLIVKPQSSSVYGKPIPLVYGANRLPGNVIWSPLEFQNTGGVGGDYQIGEALAFCEGPVVGLGRSWVGQSAPNNGLIGGPTAFVLYVGNRPQASAFAYRVASFNKTVQLTIAIPPTLDGSGHCNYTLTPVKASPISGSVWVGFSGGGYVYRESPLPGVLLNKVVNAAAIAGATDWCVSGAGPTYTLTFAGGLANAQVLIDYELSGVPYGVKYGGTSYVVTDTLDTGSTSSKSIPNISWEVFGFLFAGAANPNAADIVNDFLTNTTYGCGLTTAVEVTNGQDGTAASGYQRYCSQMGFLLAPAFIERKGALEHLKWLLDASNSDMVWSGNTLKIVPMGDTAIGTFTPYNAAVYALTNDDFLAAPGEEPISIVRKSAQDTFNDCPVEYTYADTTDAMATYAVATVDNPDQGNIQASGGELRKDSTISLKCIPSFAIADVISQIRARRSIYLRNTYRFKLGWRYSRLEPLDIVSLTEPVMGLVARLVRVRSIEENEAGELIVEAEEFIVGTGHAVARAYVP